MPELDLRTAATQVGLPHTSAQVLAQIAAEFPELWDQIDVHPNAYPDLIAWIATARAARGGTSPSWTPREQVSSAAPDAAESHVAAAPITSAPVPAAQVASGAGAQARRGIRGPLVAMGAVSFGAVVALVVTLVVVNPFPNRRLDELLALVGLPEDSQNFALDISYPGRVADAMGSDLPLEADSRGVSRWAEQAGEGAWQQVDLDSARLSPWWIESYGTIPLYADAHATLTRQVCDAEHCEERELGVWAGDVPDALLDAGFTPASGGEWHPHVEGIADPSVLSPREGGMFHRSSWDLDEGMRFADSHHEGSLADDDAALRVLRILHDTGGYAIGISRWEGTPAATSGYAIDLQDGLPSLTLVWDLRSAGEAEGFASTMEAQIREVGTALGQRLRPEVEVKGALVTAAFTFGATEEGLNAPRSMLIRQLLGNPPTDAEQTLPDDDAEGSDPESPATPEIDEPATISEAPAPAPTQDPSLLTPCVTAPIFTVRAAEYADHSLRLLMAVAATCPAGDVMAGPDHHVLIEGPSASGGVEGLPVTIAQGTFDFSDPFLIPPGGTELTLVFGPEQYFQDVTPMDLTRFAITHVPDPTPVEPAPLTAQVPAGQVVVVAATAVSPYTDSTPAERLQRVLTRDQPLVASDLTGYWTPQLASGTAGSPKDEQAFVEELGRQRAHYPSAKLIHSDDWPIFTPNGSYWVIVAGIPFETAEEALRWCEDEGFDADSCYAKRLDPQGTFEHSTRYR